MRDLTMHELDAELAEQLPARELMQFLSFNNNIAIAANVAIVTNSHNVDIDQTAVALAGVQG